MSTTTNTSNQSHAIDPATTSNLPPKVQATLPESVEDALPNNIHDTGLPPPPLLLSFPSFIAKASTQATQTNTPTTKATV